ncbi:hypothetical protein IT575_09810 [bacterium]|nr:hypothetical protein [bacterium]
MNLSLLLIWLQSSADEGTSDAGFLWWRILILLAGGAAAVYSRARGLSGFGPAGEGGAPQSGSFFNLTFGRGDPASRAFSEANRAVTARPRQIVPDLPSFDEAVADARAGLSPEQGRSQRIAAAGQSLAEFNSGLVQQWFGLQRGIEELCGLDQPRPEEPQWQLAGPLSQNTALEDELDRGLAPWPLSAEEGQWLERLQGPQGVLRLHADLLREVSLAHEQRRLRGAGLTLSGPLQTVEQVLRHAKEAADPQTRPSSRRRLRALVSRFAAGELQQMGENLRHASQLDPF